MRSRARILCLILISLFVYPVQAQIIKKFTEDPVTYPEELEQSFGKNISKENEEFIKQFKEKWNTGYFAEEEKQKVIEISNLVLQKRGRPNLQLKNYLETFILLKENAFDAKNFTLWIQGVEYYLTQPKININQINNYFDFIRSLLTKSLIFDTKPVSWKATSPDFQLTIKESPRVVFQKTDLICYAVNDSMFIYDCQGEVDPITKTWYGNKGTVTWERSGYDAAQVYAHLANYKINLNKFEYTADSVTFINKKYLKEPQQGTLTDKVVTVANPENVSYPRVDIFKDKFFIENLFENINYEGGLKMQGTNVQGTGTKDDDSRLSVYRNDTLFFEAKSQNFTFKKNRVTSQNTRIKFLNQEDSIYHTSVAFDYLQDTREITITASSKATSKIPYSNSFHKVNMNVGQISWKTDENKIIFTMPRGSTIGEAYFESFNQYNETQYYRIQGMDDIHPLLALKEFADYYYSEKFPAMEFAAYMNRPLHLIRQLLIRLSFNGFIVYDFENDEVKIEKRLYDYLDAAVEKIDYDVISFHSKVEAPTVNGEIDLNSYDLKINGIQSFPVSTVQNVMIHPKNGQITLKRNRNFTFNGTLEAGMFTFYGEDFAFDYDSFKIGLSNIDALSIAVEKEGTDDFGNPMVAHMQNMVEYITGEVLIDKPDNKSGRVDNPEYPIFSSKDSSYIFYEASSISDSLFQEYRFYFQVDPYEVKSINSFKEDQLKLTGVFHSNGVFPPIREVGIVMKDNSIGFTHHLPANGLPVYNNQGTFYDEVYLSNKGLFGKGKLEYLATTLKSEEFSFYPDSTNVVNAGLTLQKTSRGMKTPPVKGIHGKIHIVPANKELYAENTDTPFKIFDDSASFSGKLKLNEEGLKADGNLWLDNAKLSSSRFKLFTNSLNADTSNVFIKSENQKDYTFELENTHSFIDLNNKEGFFHRNTDTTSVDLKKAKYQTNASSLVWHMNEDRMEMGAAQTMPHNFFTSFTNETNTPQYVSTDVSQDSLHFTASNADYNLQTFQLNAQHVNYIDVADARIFTADGNITIDEGAKMVPLMKARVLASRENKFHSFYNAKVNIFGKNDYKASGKYDFKNANDSIEILFVDEIFIDTSGQTIARGQILEKDTFIFSSNFGYTGQFEIKANDEFILFDGFASIIHNCNLPGYPFAFTSEIDPKNIMIPVGSEVRTDQNVEIYKGILMNTDSTHIYSAFFSGRKFHSDKYISTAEGFLTYDSRSGKYLLGPKEKINDANARGNLVSFDRNFCLVEGEGDIDLGIRTDQISISSVGKASYHMEKTRAEIKVMLQVDFFFDKAALELMTNELRSVPNLTEINMKDNFQIKGLTQILGKEKALKLSGDASVSVATTPKELNHTLFLNEVTLVWNNESQSYISEGKIGIGNISGMPVNVKVDGHIELLKRRSGDYFDIYLKADEQTWYYFGYTRGVMQCMSSNEAFKTAVLVSKAKDRKLKTESGEEGYIFMIADDQKISRFFRRLKMLQENTFAKEEETEEETEMQPERLE